MIEPSWWLAGGLLAAVLAAAAWIICAQPWRAPSAVRTRCAYVAAVFGGFFGGTLVHWAVKHDLPWPPQESRQYLLVVIVPAALVAELIGAAPATPRWLAWLLRGLLIAATPPLLLLSLVRGDWTPGHSLLVCAGLAAGIAVVWVMLAWLSSMQPGLGLWLAMFVVAVGTGATLMGSGSLTISQMSLTLAAGVFGSAAAAAIFRKTNAGGASGGALAGGLGIAFLVLASILIQGNFLAELEPAPATVLALAPLTAWVACIPALRRRPWLAAVACVVACGVVVGAVAVPIVVRAMHESESVEGGEMPGG